MDVNLSLESTASRGLELWPVSLFFGGLAMLCSAIFHRRVLAVALPAFLLFASYSWTRWAGRPKTSKTCGRVGLLLLRFRRSRTA